MRAICAAQISAMLWLGVAALTCVDAEKWTCGRGKAFHKDNANETCLMSRNLKYVQRFIDECVARVPEQQESARKVLQGTGQLGMPWRGREYIELERTK
ncbi:hypothetical protein ERJ75_001809000 [Trypanosoma vivax]|nr:hypothetical protein ERJ75_001809000 [Trypanosoma vivax]